MKTISGMISEDRIHSMTKLAIFEEGEGKVPIRLANYTKGDYRALQIIKYFITGSISFLIMLFVYVFVQFSNDTLDMSLDAITGLLLRVLIVYVIFMVIYMSIGIFLSMRRFHRAKLEVKDYKKQLKNLSQLYEWERKLKTEGTLTHISLWEAEDAEDEEEEVPEEINETQEAED